MTGKCLPCYISEPLIFVTGAVLYYSLELIWRGYSHISMAVCGGICLCAISSMNRHTRNKPLPLRALYGSMIITYVEFVAGCILNLILGLNVWDYSSAPLNILGQICLPYTALWFLLCLPVCSCCSFFSRLTGKQATV